MLVFNAPYPGGGGAADRFVMRQALRTTTGTQDFVVPGATETPLAVMFVYSRAADDNTADKPHICIGRATGPGQQSADATRLSGFQRAAYKTAETGAVILGMSDVSTPTVTTRASVTAMIPGGCTVNVSATEGLASLVTMVAFMPSMFSAAAIGRSDSAVTTISPGLRANAMIGTLVGARAAPSSQGVLYQGLAGFDGTLIGQCTNTIYYGTPGNASDIQGWIRDGAFESGGGSGTQTGVIQSVGPTSLTRTYPSGSTGVDYSYLALEAIEQAKVWSGVLTTPAATGPQTMTAPGATFTPKIAILLPSNENTINRYTNNGQLGSSGMAIFDATSQFSNIVWQQDGAPLNGVIRSGGLSRSGHLYITSDPGPTDGVVTVDGAFTGFVPGGLAFNMAIASARKVPALLIG